MTYVPDKEVLDNSGSGWSKKTEFDYLGPKPIWKALK